MITVTDDGDGIAPDETEKIFEPFYRVGSAKYRTATGTGLGLAISRGIIESHGGKMNVDSTLNNGSTFYFTLSLTAPPQPE